MAHPIHLLAALAFAMLGTTCDPRPPSGAGVSEPTSATDAKAAGRFIVTLRAVPGDTARPTRATLEARLSRAALQQSGGHVVDAVPVVGALVLEGVRDPEPLRRDPNVVSVVADLEHTPHG